MPTVPVPVVSRSVRVIGSGWYAKGLLGAHALVYLQESYRVISSHLEHNQLLRGINMTLHAVT